MSDSTLKTLPHCPTNGVHFTLLGNELSNLTLDKIEQELQLLNVNMADANDIAMLAAFSSMPADLADDSRKALRRLRDKMMERAITRADL